MLNDVLVPDLVSTSNGPFMSSVLKPGNRIKRTSSFESSLRISWCSRVNILAVQLSFWRGSRNCASRQLCVELRHLSSDILAGVTSLLPCLPIGAKLATRAHHSMEPVEIATRCSNKPYRHRLQQCGQLSVQLGNRALSIEFPSNFEIEENMLTRSSVFSSSHLDSPTKPRSDFTTKVRTRNYHPSCNVSHDFSAISPSQMYQNQAQPDVTALV